MHALSPYEKAISKRNRAENVISSPRYLEICDESNNLKPSNTYYRDRKVATNEAAANRLRDDIKKRNLAKELVRARIKAECWESMDVQKKEVRLRLAQLAMGSACTCYSE